MKRKLNRAFARIHSELHTINNSRVLSAVIPLAVIICFVVLGIGLLDAFRYQINPDATSYLQIAKQYAAGDIKEAINGYWSPLLSWLLIPFVWLNIDLQLGAKILALSSSLAVLLGLWYVLSRQKFSWWISSTVLFIAASLLLSWSLVNPITGDLLFLCFALFIPLLTIRFINDPSLPNAALLGVVGSLMYFSKAIGFFIFIIYLVMAFVLHNKYTWDNVRRYVLVLLCFFVLISPYVAAISYKNEKFTISTASRYNLELTKRFSPQQSAYDHPMHWPNMLFPMPAYQYTVHENPDLLTSVLINTKPLSKYDAIKNYYHNILNNIHLLLTSLYALLIIFGLGFLLQRRSKNTFLPNVSSIRLFVSLGIITLGAVLVSIYETRYIYLPIIISLIGVGFLLQKSRTYIYTVLCCLFLCIWAFPVYSNLIADAYIDNDLRQNTSYVSQSIPKDSNIVSDSSASLYYCYYGEFRCRGNIVVTQENVKDINQLLKQNNIEYYLLINPETLTHLKSNDLIDKLDVKVITAFVY